MTLKSMAKRFVATLATASMALLAIGVSGTAQAAPNLDYVGVYLDAPLVQGSYVAFEAQIGTSWTDFNNTPGAGRCADSQPAAMTITGDCSISAVSVYGGAAALTDEATATVGRAGTEYATTVNNLSPITITLDSDNRYLGLWWSAGSPSNTVKFYDGDRLLLTMTTQDIITLLGTAPTSSVAWSAKNNDDAGNLLTTVDGSKHRKVWYFGNPRGYASTTPSARSTITATEPFMYLHMFVGGALTFDKVVLTGGGFEFDNLAVSTLAQTPASNLVNVSTIYANHTVSFDSNGSGVTETMAPLVGSTATPLTGNSFTRAGYTFAGWNTLADGTGTNYADLASYDFDEDLTLFAIWTPVESQESTTSDLANTGIDSVGLTTGALMLVALGAVLARRRYLKKH